MTRRSDKAGENACEPPPEESETGSSGMENLELSRWFMMDFFIAGDTNCAMHGEVRYLNTTDTLKFGRKCVKHRRGRKQMGITAIWVTRVYRN